MSGGRRSSNATPLFSGRISVPCYTTASHIQARKRQRSPPIELARPFAALRAAAEHAATVAAPPYDVVTREEAGALARDNPLSFLHVSRAEIDLPASTGPYDARVYDTAAANLARLEREGALVRDAEPAYYVYRMDTAAGTQTGVAFSASIEAYLENRIRRHELTRPAKEDDRVRQIEAVGAGTGPVLLVHRDDAPLAALLAEAAAGTPDADVPDLDGTRHRVWRVADPARAAAIGARLNAAEALYIADGHHRSAAAARVCAARRERDPALGPDAACAGFLAVSFPEHEVRILDYNRVVRDLNGLGEDAFLDALGERFELRPSAAPVRPTAPGHFGLYLDGRWHTLAPLAPPDEADPVERLDVRILERLVLAPVLGIEDVRSDPRIDFVGGSRGVEGVAARVDAGEMAAGFTLHPTRLADLMAVADAGRIMPPKSTWFDPKLADGLLSLPLG